MLGTLLLPSHLITSYLLPTCLHYKNRKTASREEKLSGKSWAVPNSLERFFHFFHFFLHFFLENKKETTVFFSNVSNVSQMFLRPPFLSLFQLFIIAKWKISYWYDKNTVYILYTQVMTVFQAVHEFLVLVWGVGILTIDQTYVVLLVGINLCPLL